MALVRENQELFRVQLASRSSDLVFLILELTSKIGPPGLHLSPSEAVYSTSGTEEYAVRTHQMSFHTQTPPDTF